MRVGCFFVITRCVDKPMRAGARIAFDAGKKTSYRRRAIARLCDARGYVVKPWRGLAGAIQNVLSNVAPVGGNPLRGPGQRSPSSRFASGLCALTFVMSQSLDVQNRDAAIIDADELILDKPLQCLVDALSRQSNQMRELLLRDRQRGAITRIQMGIE